MTSSTSVALHQIGLQLVSGIASAMVLAHPPQWHHRSYVCNTPILGASHQPEWQLISLSGFTSAIWAVRQLNWQYRSYGGT